MNDFKMINVKIPILDDNNVPSDVAAAKSSSGT